MYKDEKKVKWTKSNSSKLFVETWQYSCDTSVTITNSNVDILNRPTLTCEQLLNNTTLWGERTQLETSCILRNSCKVSLCTLKYFLFQHPLRVISEGIKSLIWGQGTAHTQLSLNEAAFVRRSPWFNITWPTPPAQDGVPTGRHRRLCERFGQSLKEDHVENRLNLSGKDHKETWV